MVTTGGRESRRLIRQDYLDSGSINISSSDDELSSNRITGTRRSQRNADHDPPRRSLRQGFGSRSISGQNRSNNESETEQRSSNDRRPARRSIRLRVTRDSPNPFEFSEDEEDDEEYEDPSDENTIRVGGSRSKKRRGRPSKDSRGVPRLKLTHRRDPGSDYVNQRRSSRNRTGLVRSMREKGEDEISENEAKVTGTRIIGAKEIFVELSEQHPFRARHRQICDTCGDFEVEDDNPLVFCQGCTNSHHKNCLGPRGTRDHLVTKVGQGDFVLQCRRCVEVAHNKDSALPELSLCQKCKVAGPACEPFRARKTTRQEQLEREANAGEDLITDVDVSKLNNPDNVLFRCATCQRSWHMNHLPPRSNKEDAQVDSEDESSPTDRFDEYSSGWTCRECFNAPKSGIDALVAWRPSNMDAYVPGSTAEIMAEDDKDYLVKWKKLSYFRTTWMPGAWVAGVAASAMRRAFLKKDPNPPKMRTEDAIPEDWFRVDIVLGVKYTSIVSKLTKDIALARVKEVEEAYVKYKGLGYEDVVWEKPPSPEDGERWEDFKAAYEDMISGHFIHIPNQSTLRKHINQVKAQEFEPNLVQKTQPTGIEGGQMMDYQLDGLNWLYFKWYKGQNAVLADEMGLGKTIQLIALFSLLVQAHKCWPFLVVVPNSTCPNWRREIKKWAPHLRVVAYYGSSAARKLAYDYELFPNNKDDLQAHVVITSYDAVVDIQSRKLTRKIPWAGLVVDEGQRLKNDENILYEELRYLKAPFQVLLTGSHAYSPMFTPSPLCMALQLTMLRNSTTEQRT
jgi:chromodomain-helicase-DNA-binding protein 4